MNSNNDEYFKIRLVILLQNELKVSATYVTKKYAMNKKSKAALFFKKSQLKSNHFFALRGVSFEVFAGETIGIIGTNGSGKSTLSSIIAGSTAPTSGKIIVNGKTSIIAINSGLKPELTGRENIRLKCLLSGMSNKEIDLVMEDIIYFSELDEFIDQPLKNYSSGMKSRLGFAISIHHDPDILIIDEALSVGDETFYQKCLDKMTAFKEEGKTIFFVSHSAKQIRNLCDKTMWIHEGKKKQFDATDIVLEKYNAYIQKHKKLSKKEKIARKKKYQTIRKEFTVKAYYERKLIKYPDEGFEQLRHLFQENDVKVENNLLFYLAITVLIGLLILVGGHYLL